jgi:hypothetical protein
MSDLDLVIEEVDLLVAEAAWMNERGPHFIIVHRWREPGSSGCLPGEEVAQVRLIHRAQEYPLKLGLGPLIEFDYLAHHRWLPINASRLAAEMNADPFCSSHAANAPKFRKRTRRYNHASVKVFAQRIRDAMKLAFRDAEIAMDPRLVLISEPGYRLMASVEWIHLADPRQSAAAPRRKMVIAGENVG